MKTTISYEMVRSYGTFRGKRNLEDCKIQNNGTMLIVNGWDIDNQFQFKEVFYMSTDKVVFN